MKLSKIIEQLEYIDSLVEDEANKMNVWKITLHLENDLTLTIDDKDQKWKILKKYVENIGLLV